MKHDFYYLLADIMCCGKEVRPRGHLTKEILGATLVIDDFNFMATPGARDYESVYKYWFQETCWYMSGELNPANIVRHAKMWGEITNEYGNINSNYGYRVFYRQNKFAQSGFEFALETLRNDKDSRNAIILYNEPDLCYKGNKDFICSQSQHFLIRNNELLCFIHLRSSDAVFGLYYNCPWWSLVQQQLRLALLSTYPDLKLGRIEVFISSAHIYERHFPLVEKILAGGQHKYFVRWNKIIPRGHSFESYQKNLKDYFTVENVAELC